MSRSIDPAREQRGRKEPVEETVARGRAAKTPFVLLGGVAAVVWAVVALVTAAALLVWWLA